MSVTNKEITNSATNNKNNNMSNTNNGSNNNCNNNNGVVEMEVPKFKTAREIVEWIVLENSDVPLQSCFLLSYRVIFSSDDLYHALAAMLNMFLFLWGELSYHYDWKSTTDKLAKLMELAKVTSLSPGQFNYFKQFVVKERRNRACNPQSITFTPGGAVGSSPSDSSSSPNFGERLRVMKLRKTRSRSDDFMPAWFNIEPVTFAEQITLLEHEVCSIKACELLKKSHHDKTLQVDAIAARFNEVASWVSNQVLCLPQPKMQAAAIKRFIIIAEELLALNNFQSAGQILSGLFNSSVTRLKKPSAFLSNKSTMRLKRIEELMSPSQNFIRLRELQQEAQGKAMIPYIPLLLRDITFMCDGNPNHNTDGSLNFEKLLTLGKQLLWYKDTMTMRYRIDVDMGAQTLLHGLKPVSEDELYKLSLDCEPKNFPSTPSTTTILPTTPKQERATTVLPAILQTES